MNDKGRDIIKVNLDEAFEKGQIFNATDADLNRYLQHLCSGSVGNDAVRHREMNRCLVINTIKNFRFLDHKGVKRGHQKGSSPLLALEGK